MFTAWQTARFTAYSGERLKPLRDALEELKGPQQRRRQTPEEMIEALRVIRRWEVEASVDLLGYASAHARIHRAHCDLPACA
jgi:hypothetical protein